MAGDWLKVETATPDKPEVWEIASILDIDPDAAFGKVFRVWSWFDQHTEEGNAPSVSKALLDRKVGVSKFADAMLAVGWLVENDGQVIMPNFDNHNGASAKKRANTARRVAKHAASKDKTNADTNAELTQPALGKALAREEKRREELKEAHPALNVDKWLEWEAYRRGRKLKAYTTDRTIKSIIVLTKDQQAKCIDDSMTKEYQGLFPENYLPQAVPLKNKSDAELMKLAEAIPIHTAGLTRWQLIDAIEAKQ